MKIDLSDEELFYEDEINFDKNLNFVFGKNGTGKSTLTKLLKKYGEQDYDVRVFQGFENMVGANNRLNAVILGEENNEIAQEIEIKKEEKTKSGILLSSKSSNTDTQNQAEVIALGKGEKLDGIKVGDKVIFNKFSGNEIEDGDIKYLIVNADDILAVIE